MSNVRLRNAMGLLILIVAAHPLPADDSVESVLPDVKKAITKSLDLIEKSTIEYRNHRSCFSCHHQAMSTFALAEASKRGFQINEENFQKQLDWTAEHLKRGRTSYLKGNGQGGKADTAGYALWTLEVGDWKPDETTEAVTEFLLLWKKESDHWRRSGSRPPSEASDITTTYLAIRELSVFGTEKQNERIAERIKQAQRWLRESEPKDTEEHVFRFRSLAYLDAADDAVQGAARELIKQQRDDGGWRQTAELESDAYATGTVLVALHEYGALSVDSPVYQRGLRWLIKNQLDDGSWHVRSRSKPIQTYFESGFPHGKDQFISITASCWSTMALLFTMPIDGSP